MKKIIISTIFIILFLFAIIERINASTCPLKQIENTMVKCKETNYLEKDYIAAYCNGVCEYPLPDKTRVDCLTDEYAIEFDYAKKWAESIGQSLYYAKMTGKKPAVAIIMKSPDDRRYIKRIEITDPNIRIFEIKAYRD